MRLYFINKFLLAAFLIIISSLAASAKSNSGSAEEDFINKLDQALIKEDTNQIFDIFQKIDNGNKLNSAAAWLQAKIFKHSDSRLFYLYSTTLLRMTMVKMVDYSKGKYQDIGALHKKDLQESAALMFWMGRLMLFIDGARCADTTVAYTTILYEMESGIGEDINKIWQSYDQKHKQKIINIVLNLEHKRLDRVPQKWICQRGLKAMSDYLAKDLECKGCTEEPSDVPGKMAIIIPTNKIDPKLIDKQKWLAKRQKIRESFSPGIEDAK